MFFQQSQEYMSAMPINTTLPPESLSQAYSLDASTLFPQLTGAVPIQFEIDGLYEEYDRRKKKAEEGGSPSAHVNAVRPACSGRQVN